MNREIKFRAWDGSKIITGFADERTSNYIINFDGSIGNYSEDGDFYRIENSDLILMQYTGLKDKNGKEIYEDDLLKRKDTGTTGVVAFQNGKFVIKWKPILGYVMFDSDIETSYNDEVIGNIYENPELI